MLKIPTYSMQHILCLVYFAKDGEDWFGYGKLNGLIYRDV